MPRVTIYTRQFCGFCTAAKNLLRKKGIEFEEIDATGAPDRRSEMMERSGRFTFPQIFAGDRHIGDCDELYELEARGELDRLLGESVTS